LYRTKTKVVSGIAGSGGSMKKMIIAGAIAAVLVLITLIYLRIGSTAAEKGTEMMEQSQGTIDQARQAMDALNESVEESKKAIEQAGKQ
jgi:methyl-accepting chemotaxis protein